MFVGRRFELDRLGAVALGLSRGAAAALVVGEPGSGKTRLLEEVVRRAPPARSRLHVVGYEAEQAVPFAAAATLLRLLDDAGARGGHVADASVLEPIRVFEAVYRRLHDDEPVVLVVDDLQWADELSRALVHYVVRGAAAEDWSLVVLGASRPGEVARSFGDSLVHALPVGRVEVVELGPLEQEAGVELALSLAPGLGEDAALEIWARSGGVPFWLEALALGGGDLRDVERAVGGRLRGLNSDAVALLAVLVVATRPLAAVTLAELEGWQPERVERAVGELVAAGVATRRGLLVQPVHDLLREAASRELPDDLRREVHTRLAHWLEAQGEDISSLREAVEHRVRAGLPVSDALVRIVEHPRRRLLGREGLLDLEAIAGAGADERSPALETGLATLASELAVHRVAEARWTAVSQHADDPLGAARAALEGARSAYLADRTAAAWTLLRRARSLCSDEILELEIDAHEASIRRWLDHDVRAADELTSRALSAANALVERAGGVHRLDRAQLSAVHEALSAGVDGALVADDNERGLELAFRLVDVAGRLSEMKRLRALLRRANMLGLAGRLREDEDDLRTTWAAARERILPALEIEAGFALGAVLLVRGNLREAERVAEAAAALADRGGAPTRMVATPWRLQQVPLFIRIARGDWQQALVDLRAAVEAERDPHRRLHFQQTIALWLARLDSDRSRDEVAARFAAAQKDADAARCRRCRGEIDVRAAEALARVGLVSESRRLARAWDDGHPAPRDLSAFWRARAEAAVVVAEGDRDQAAALFEELATRSAALELKLEGLWIAIDHGSALAGLDGERAVGLLRAAAEEAEAIGAGTLQAVALARLRALGVRAWRRGASGGTLTEREREIGRLIATGASNPEIAQALFLSRKTIERHVSNMLRKLGARNRAELASRLSEDSDVEGAHR